MSSGIIVAAARVGLQPLWQGLPAAGQCVREPAPVRRAKSRSTIHKRARQIEEQRHDLENVQNVSYNDGVQFTHIEDVPMRASRIITTVQADGELHLTQLPCRKGERVEVIISSLDTNGDPITDQQKREEARQCFLEQARASQFRSTGPYPSRPELHERH